MNQSNWKTTLAGIAGGFLIAFGPAAGARLQGDKTAPPITLNNVLAGLAVGVLGWHAQDKPKNGQ